LDIAGKLCGGDQAAGDKKRRWFREKIDRRSTRLSLFLFTDAPDAGTDDDEDEEGRGRVRGA
jgi:hypothetical protein